MPKGGVDRRAARLYGPLPTGAKGGRGQHFLKNVSVINRIIARVRSACKAEARYSLLLLKYCSVNQILLKFLDDYVRTKASLRATDTVLEIGPGNGAMTVELLQKVCRYYQSSDGLSESISCTAFTSCPHLCSWPDSR